MRLLILCFIFLFACRVSAQNNYQVSKIPSELLPRASAVIRTMDLTVEVKSLNQVNYKIKQAITVLNKNGDEDATIRIWYNKSRKIHSIKGIMYDEFGKPFSKLSQKEFLDRSAASNSSLFEDSRVKIFKPTSLTYPYTLEYEYEIRSNQSLNLPSWYPNSSTGVAVEHATFNFVCKPDFGIRYKETNYPGKVEIDRSDKFTTYHWEVNNVKAIRDEPYSPLPQDFLTSVQIAPNEFSYQGIKGSFSNWEEYGKWVYDVLLKDRNAIPEQTANYIKRITRDIADPKEKAKVIYEYMQQKTRYVSIQVGIGGYQPFLASDVDRTSYGDCKALVNYTQGLLDVVGIDSYYVVVASGNKKQDAIPDFASMNQFDHVILCLPFENDTLWAECTSRDDPFGYLGTFTDDRLAVACTKDGGKLMRTPKFDANRSQQIRVANIRLDSSGSIKGEMKTVFSGWQYDNRSSLVNEPLKEQLKKVPEIYQVENMLIKAFQLEQDKSQTPTTTELLNFEARNYGALNANLMYVPFNKLNQSTPPKEVKGRENDLYINRGYVDVDSVVFELPTMFKIENLPQPVSIEYPFGSFSTNISVKGDAIHYSRKVQLKQGTYPVEQYTDFVSFYRALADADNKRFVLKKTTL